MVNSSVEVDRRRVYRRSTLLKAIELLTALTKPNLQVSAEPLTDREFEKLWEIHSELQHFTCSEIDTFMDSVGWMSKNEKGT